ncbi:MAG: hypothetical protein P8N46_06455, partial [Flavobacteriales bacterium]|nr:hypothetical protein [Flavobacteriales bacterium]
MKKITTSIAYSLIAVLLFSCGSDKNETESNVEIETQIVEVSETTKNWEEFTVKALGNTMPEMKYDLTNISVKEGSWVRIKLINDGIDPSMLHNIVFVNYG